VATTTFTVKVARRGRLSGTTCQQPSKHNRHGRKCTYEASLGHFIHADLAGPNTIVFTGRTGGKSLRPGTYRLEGVATNANGPSAPLDASFTITR
jgi:hypothetical protein